ncbi:MAG: hypothetical protein JO035_16900 [Betaproteobacteria bacterium]|nr:hypothetical protein [Betaproteobacteria bacterium]
MKAPGLVAVCLALAVFGLARPSLAATATAGEFVSFAELYRATVGAPLPEAGAARRAPEIRVASLESRGGGFALAPAAQAAAAPVYVFSAPSLPEPASRWVLLISGLALALWVARRRLGYSL